MIKSSYNPITGVQYTSTDGYQGVVTKTQYDNISENMPKTSITKQPKSVKPSKKCNTKKKLVAKSQPSITPQKSKKKRESFNFSVKYITTTKQRTPRRWNRRITIALQKMRETKVAIQTTVINSIKENEQ